MLNDFRHALRVTRRSPGFSLTAVITLALGIGATTGVYSIYSAVFLKPLPFDHPERVAAIWVRDATGGLYGIAGGTLTEVRSLPAVEHAAVVVGTENTLLGAGEPELLRGALASGEFFDVLQVRPAIGRLLNVNDTRGGASPVVLSHSLWQRRFNGDPGLVGRPLRLGDTVHTVVGILPAGVRYPEDADYWAPYDVSAAELSRLGRGPFAGLARLKRSDLDAAAAQAAVLRIAASDTDEELNVTFVPLVESMAGPYRSNLTLLLGAVTMVLLIACFNVANLLLAHITAREQELAVRAAIGATRWRLLRQLLAESLILALAGAVAGMAVARLIVMSVPLIGTPEIPRVNQLALDWRVLTFAAATAAASVCVFGLVPALFATGRLRPVLGSGRCVEGPRKRTTSNLLIAVQIAGTLVLLVASALALTSLYRLHNVDMGFNTRQLTVTTIRPSTTTLQEPGALRFYDRVLDGLRAQPGFESVATMSHVPLEPALAAAASVTTDKGVVLPEGRNGPRVRVMSPAALQTLGVPILHGRDFLPADRNGAPLVAIVNDTLAHRLWGDRDAIGNSLVIESRGRKRTYRVAGVARDFRASLRRVPQPEAYLAAAQEPSRLKVVVRSALPPDVVAARIRAVVSSEDPDVPITAVSTVTGLVRSGAAYTRFHAVLLAAFGVVGALLASMGILAVVASTVAYRTREIGVRIAIGATPHHVVTLMAREMTVPVVGGLAAGLLGIYNLASLLQQRGVLFEVNQFEPGLYTVVTLALSVLAIAAAWLPARRAARVQPMVALRSE